MNDGGEKLTAETERTLRGRRGFQPGTLPAGLAAWPRQGPNVYRTEIPRQTEAPLAQTDSAGPERFAPKGAKNHSTEGAINISLLTERKQLRYRDYFARP